jgi:hypothetical protein
VFQRTPAVRLKLSGKTLAYHTQTQINYPRCTELRKQHIAEQSEVLQEVKPKEDF